MVDVPAADDVDGGLTAARKLVAERRYDEALTCYDELLARSPEDETARYGRVHCLRRLGRLTQAIAAARAALKAAPEDARLSNELWRALMAAQRHDQALEAALHAQQSDLVSASLRSLLFDAAPAMAAATLDRLLNSTWSREHPLLLAYRCRLALDDGRLHEAAAFLERARQAAPADETVLITAIELERRLGDPAAAHRSARQAAARHPANGRLRSLVYITSEELEEALLAQGALKAALELMFATGGVEKLIRRTRQMRIAGQRDAAAALLSRALEVDSADAVAARGLLLRESAALHIAGGELDAAYEDLEAITVPLTLTGDDGPVDGRLRLRSALDEIAMPVMAWRGERLSPPADPVAAKVMVRRLQGRLDEALQLAVEQERSAESSAELTYELGLVYLERKDYPQAVSLLVRQGREQTLLEYAGKLRELRNFADAGALLDEGLRQRPRSSGLLAEAARVALDRGQHDRVLFYANHMLQINSASMVGIALKVDALCAAGRWAEVAKFCQMMLAKHPDAPDLLVGLARAKVWAAEWTEAEKLLGAAIQQEEGWRYPRLLLADVLASQNRRREAVELIERLLRDDPDVLELRENLGWALLRAYELGAARSQFDAVLAQDPDRAEALDGLGVAAMLKEQYEIAEPFFRRSVELSPETPEYLTRLAWVIVEKREEARYCEARRMCERALLLDADAPFALGQLGVLCIREGRLREAEEYLRRSVRLARRQGEWLYLGALYVQQGRYAEAEEVLADALIALPDDPDLQVEMANLHLTMRDWAKAESLFWQASATDSRNGLALLGLATVFRDGEPARPHQAEQVLRTAIRRGVREQWRLHLTLASLLADQVSDASGAVYREEALEAAAEATRRHPESETFIETAKIRARLGDLDGALRDLDACLAVDGENAVIPLLRRHVEELQRRRRTARLGRWGRWTIMVTALATLGVLWLCLRWKLVQMEIVVLLSPFLFGAAVVAAASGWRPSEVSIPGIVKFTPPARPMQIGPKAMASMHLSCSLPSPSVLPSRASLSRPSQVVESASRSLEEGSKQAHGPDIPPSSER